MLLKVLYTDEKGFILFFEERYLFGSFFFKEIWIGN